jgi:ribosomal protein S25
MSKKAKKTVKTEVKKIVRDAISESELIEKLKKDLKSFQYLTPLIVTNKYNVSLGVSKRVLRKLAEANLIKLVANNPRSPLYMIPK